VSSRVRTRPTLEPTTNWRRAVLRAVHVESPNECVSGPTLLLLFLFLLLLLLLLLHPKLNNNSKNNSSKAKLMTMSWPLESCVKLDRRVWAIWWASVAENCIDVCPAILLSPLCCVCSLVLTAIVCSSFSPPRVILLVLLCLLRLLPSHSLLCGGSKRLNLNNKTSKLKTLFKLTSYLSRRVLILATSARPLLRVVLRLRSRSN